MNLNDMLPAGALDALASQLGIPREQAQRGAKALLPSIVGGMGDAAGRQAVSHSGDLEAHIQRLGGGLADNVMGPEPTEIAKGNDILGKIFGSKDVSRQVAGHAAQNTGLDLALLKRMLPILAMLVAGSMTKRTNGQQGGFGGILGTVLGGLAGAGGSASGGSLGSGSGGVLGGILGSILGSRR